MELEDSICAGLPAADLATQILSFQHANTWLLLIVLKSAKTAHPDIHRCSWLHSVLYPERYALNIRKWLKVRDACACTPRQEFMQYSALSMCLTFMLLAPMPGHATRTSLQEGAKAGQIIASSWTSDLYSTRSCPGLH